MKFHEYLIDENDGEGGWVDTHYFNDAKEADDEVTLGEEAKEVEAFAQSKPTPTVEDDGDDSEAEDIESFVNERLDDENDEVSVSLFCFHFNMFILSQAAIDITKISENLNKLNVEGKPSSEESGVVKTRTYDLYITYDKYYQTPRLWLVGYDEHNKPLTIEEMYEDIR